MTRQKDLATDWCEKNDAVLDTTLRMDDKGLSGWKGILHGHLPPPRHRFPAHFLHPVKFRIQSLAETPALRDAELFSFSGFHRDQAFKLARSRAYFWRSWATSSRAPAAIRPRAASSSRLIRSLSGCV